MSVAAMAVVSTIPMLSSGILKRLPQGSRDLVARRVYVAAIVENVVAVNDSASWHPNCFRIPTKGGKCQI